MQHSRIASEESRTSVRHTYLGYGHLIGRQGARLV